MTGPPLLRAVRPHGPRIGAARLLYLLMISAAACRFPPTSGYTPSM